MILEAALTLTKCSGVIVTAAVLDDRGHVVMEHLVKDDRLDEIRRHPRLIEHGVNPNQPLLGEIRTELQRPLTAFGLQAFAPGNANLERAPEVPAPEVVEDRSQIVVSSFCTQFTLGATSRDEPVPMRLDEAIDEGRSAVPSAAEIVTHGREDILVGSQKHVVKPHFESAALGLGGEHGTAVVGDHEANRLTQLLGQGSAPALGTRVRLVELVPDALGLGSVRDRLGFADKLEGKLQHLALGLEVCRSLVNLAFSLAIRSLD